MGMSNDSLIIKDVLNTHMTHELVLNALSTALHWSE